MLKDEVHGLGSSLGYVRNLTERAITLALTFIFGRAHTIFDPAGSTLVVSEPKFLSEVATHRYDCTELVPISQEPRAYDQS
jgi:hypothetical protein